MTTPRHASIAILGAGPIGLEAALYARRLGFAVTVHERGQAAESLRRFGQVRLFSPFGMNASPLGIATIREANGDWQPPAADAPLTAGQFVEGYLQPLANLPELEPRIRQGTTVVAIGRDGLLKGDHVGTSSRAARPFRLLLRGQDGREWSEPADIVLDCSGVYGNANRLGGSGIPAEGEAAASRWIEHGLPDVLGVDRPRYGDKTTLLVGAGYSAATNVIALAELAEHSPRTRVVWLTRRAWPTDVSGQILPPDPIARIDNDRLPERDRVARRANALAAGESRAVEHHSGCSVARLQPEGDRVRVFAKQTASNGTAAAEHEFVVDRILANCGFRPDSLIYQELQVHECYASGGPMKLAAALLGQVSADCLDQVSPGPETLRTTEPNFFILGAKSYGRNSKFLLSVGLEQIRDVFRLISGDVKLNLNAT